MRQKEKTTAQVIHEYGEILTKYYLVVMLAALPLYYQDGYANIANAKYGFYKVITITYVLLCGAGCFGIETAIRKAENIQKKQPLPIIMMELFLLFNLISFIFSSDHEKSWIGRGSWHMGLLSQVLFIVTALLVYYYYKNENIVWIAAGVGAAVTGILTVLNRFNIYPLDMGNTYPGFISTLGQTNWATMYMACLMGAGIAMYIYENKPIRRIIILMADIAVFMGAWVVGSDTILPVILVELYVLFGICLRERKMLERFSVILAVLGVVTELTYILVFVLFHDKFVFVDETDAVNTLLKKQAGILILLLAAVFVIMLRFTKEKQWNGKLLKLIYRGMTVAIAVFIIGIIIAMVIVTNAPQNAGSLAKIRMLRFDYDWGTHRGLNWRCAVYGFARMPLFRKLIGVGQGGFEPYIYSFEDFAGELTKMYGKYKLMVAHNEYLNLLIENGILGCATYLAFVLSAFKLFWKNASKELHSLMAILALSGYFACSLFFFQHVYATSFMYIFVAMGLCANGEIKKA